MTTPWRLFALAGTVVALLLSALVVLRFMTPASAAPGPDKSVAFPSAARVPLIAFMGDSYSAGTGGSGYLKRFTSLVAKYEGWDSRDFAVGGTGYVHSVKRDARVGCGLAYCPHYSSRISDVAALDPTVVMVSGGRNDVGVPMTEERVAITAFYDQLRKELPNTRIYATSPIWDDRTPPAELEEIGAAVRKAVEKVGGTYLDIGEPLRAHRDLVAADGIHPNDLGHAAVARNVERALSAVS